MSISGIGNIGGMNQVQALDIETVMLAVQTGRAQALETQLKGQLETVQQKNDQIAAANQQIVDKQAQQGTIEATKVQNTAKIASNEQTIKDYELMKSQLKQVNDRDPNGWTGLSWGWAGDDKAKSQEMLQRVRAAGLTDVSTPPRDTDRNGTMDACGATIRGWMSQLDSKIAAMKAENTNLAATNDKLTVQAKDLGAEVDGLKRQIDGLSNSQQMDMLRLQSLSNKRNEAFDIMTNFIKKLQENRSSIIGNLR